jgi:hypothetical protein
MNRSVVFFYLFLNPDHHGWWTKRAMFKKMCSGCFKGIVSPDWKGLQMVSLDRFEV